MKPHRAIVYSSQESYERGTNIVPVLQIRKLWLREVKELAHGHIARSGKAKI